MVLVADIETTGLELLTVSPIQIAYAVFKPTGEEVHKDQIFLQTPNLPAEITKLTGITQEDCDKGLSHIDAARKWKKIFFRYNIRTVVGHNYINFDFPILTNWLLRTLAGENFILPGVNQLFDTMMTGRDVIGTRKWPKLAALAAHFGIVVSADSLHNAFYDVELTAACYFKILEHFANLNKTKSPEQLSLGL